MPTYEYKCKQCGHQFEAFQKISDDPLTECPECGGEVVRLISGGTGLIFKGSGFYLTDYARKNSSSAPKNGNGKAQSKSESKTSSKSESSDSK
ncbi:MAG TPA: zinc ribbon domain-containing protein [Calditrichae bacterium]|nr:zinc ribbon domain-containing protein [Calditrichia bacterium]